MKKKDPTSRKLLVLKKTGRKTPKESKEMQEVLRELFLEDGMTAYQAAQITGNHFRTVQNYFDEWADEIIKVSGHETWIAREKRVRARALEGISKKLTSVRTRLAKLYSILDELIEVRSLVTKHEKALDRKLQAVVNTLDDDKFDKLNSEIERYERIVRLNDILASELQIQFDSIEMMPPSEAILDRELEKLIAEKQGISSKTTSS
jgi:hypothetical protein